MNKLLLTLTLLGGCGDQCVDRSERHLGYGANCEHLGDFQVACQYNNDNYLCFTHGMVMCMKIGFK